ncbi:MAG TPA: hypothetical protein VM735_11295, partial [Candidatus Kapabacteria bacterium]|nr:hypothetical protein [Candidatus Kapabacteria bacterium]
DKSKIEANSLGFGDGRGIDVGVAGDLTLSNGGQINSLSPSGLGASGNIDISAGAVRLIGDGTVDYFFNPSTQISSSTGDLFFGGGAAKGGDISIKTGILEVGNSAQISSATFGMGDAGRIEIEASSLRLNAQMVTLAQITANTQLIYGGGRAGDIIIRADNLTLENGAAILAATFGTGAAGVIDIETQSMEVLSGAIISAGTFGSAEGGNVEVTANKLRIDGRDTFFGGPDLITGIQAVTGGSARGGNININAESIEMVHMGTMFTSSLFGEGPGGNIEIQTGSLTLGSGATIRAAGEAIGPAGQISINARGSVTLEGGSSIATSAPMSSGGDIHVSTGADLRLVDSEINAQAGLDGGNITVSAADLIYLLNSRLTAQADTTGSGFGNGGNLVIGPSSFLILNEGALISKSSLGNGGNITILSDYFFQSESLIDASAPFGLPGTVIVTAPDVDLSASLIGLPGDLLDAASELRPDCAIRLSDGVSSFVVLGRGGLPIQPGGFLPSGMVPLRHEPK